MAPSLVRRLVLAAALTLAATSVFAAGGALSLVPADAVSVGVVRVADLRSSPLSSTLFQHADRFGTNGEAAQFLTDAGLDLAKDIDVLVVATSPLTRLGSEGEVLVLADGRFSVDRLSAALVSRGAVRKANYFTLPDSDRESNKTGAVAFPSATLAIAGSESAVIEALQAFKDGGTGFAQSILGHEVGRVEAGASAWALVDVTRASRLTGGTDGLQHHGNKQHGQALSAAVRNISTVGMWATDTGDSLKLGAFGLTSDAETLQLVEDTLRGALSALRLSVKDRNPELVPVLRRFEVQRSDNAVEVTGSIPGDTLRDLMSHKRAKK